MSNYASGFSLEPRLCVKTETVITYPLLYPHISIVVEGNLKLYQLFTPCKPYLPKSSDEFRPVCRGGVQGGSNKQVSKQKLHLIHGLTDYQVSNCVATFYYMLYSHLIVVG